MKGVAPPVAELDVTDYRDDLPDRGARSADRAARQQPLPVEVAGRVVVLVDDVLFTGRTARAGLEAVLDHGRPRRSPACRDGGSRPSRTAHPRRLRRQERANRHERAHRRAAARDRRSDAVLLIRRPEQDE